MSRVMYLTDDLYKKDGRTHRVRVYLQKIPNKPYGEKTYDYKFIPNDVVVAYIKISEKEYENVEKISRLRPEQGYSPDPRYFKKIEEYKEGLQRFLENEGFEHRIWD
jgi:hypothetical protein